MGTDSYGPYDKQARCAQCGQFMSWDRSRLTEKSDGMPLPSPIYIEQGLCAECENKKVGAQ